jgi:hypothetical protein
MDSNRESLLESLGCIGILACRYSHNDLPIIVSYPITSLMLFVHLHIIC